MSKLVSLHNKAHQSIRICPQKVENQAAHLRSVPVMLSEFQKLIVQFPIVLTKHTETGQFACVAMFGFNDQENLFFNHNQWDTLYTPLNIARLPFFVGSDIHSAPSPDDQQYLICIDIDSETIQSNNGEALFDDAGKATCYLQRMQSILAQLIEGEKETQDFINKLLELELVQPMKLDINFINGESHQVNGTYTINEEKLNSLPTHKVNELHSLGYLGPIYILIASLGQIYSLVEKKNARLSKQASVSAKSA